MLEVYFLYLSETLIYDAFRMAYCCHQFQYSFKLNKMKALKILIFTGLILLPGLNLKAQKINYGIQAGYVYANAHVRKDNEYATRVFYPMHSFNINGTIEYRFPGAWGISIEPGYIRKGGVVDPDTYNWERFDLQLNYIQLPLLVNRYFTEKLFLSFGPEFAYLINKDGNSKYLEEEFSRFKFTSFKENALEISALIGVNYSITKKIDLGLRYNHSLTNFSVVSWRNPRYPPGAGYMGHSDAYNQYLQFLFRYKINTGADK